MREVLLLRHGESLSNVGDLAFGNRGATLTKRAKNDQIPKQKAGLILERGIDPKTYQKPVVCSTYERTFETLVELGFKSEIHRLPILDESEIYDRYEGISVVEKHFKEDGWIPDEELERSKRLLGGMRDGSIPYEIMCGHGMVFAGIITLLNAEGASFPFVEGRGFIPPQASITAIRV